MFPTRSNDHSHMLYLLLVAHLVLNFGDTSVASESRSRVLEKQKGGLGSSGDWVTKVWRTAGVGVGLLFDTRRSADEMLLRQPGVLKGGGDRQIMYATTGVGRSAQRDCPKSQPGFMMGHDNTVSASVVVLGAAGDDACRRTYAVDVTQGREGRTLRCDRPSDVIRCQKAIVPRQPERAPQVE